MWCDELPFKYKTLKKVESKKMVEVLLYTHQKKGVALLISEKKMLEPEY